MTPRHWTDWLFAGHRLQLLYLLVTCGDHVTYDTMLHQVTDSKLTTELHLSYDRNTVVLDRCGGPWRPFITVTHPRPGTTSTYYLFNAGFLPNKPLDVDVKTPGSISSLGCYNSVNPRLIVRPRSRQPTTRWHRRKRNNIWIFERKSQMLTSTHVVKESPPPSL